MHPRSSRLALWGAGFLVLLSGCTRHWDEGTATHFAWELWVGGGVILLGMACVPIGFFTRGIPEKLGYLLIFGGVVMIALAPGLFLEHVVVRPDGFSVRTGLWFMPNEHDIKFSDIQSMVMTSKTTRGRRGRTTTTNYLECQTSAGIQAVPIGSLVESALPNILLMAAAQNIPIEGHIGGEGPEAPVIVDAPMGDDVPELIEKLSSGNEKVSEQASRILIRQGPAAVGPLLNALESENSKVRYWAAHTLGGIGPAAAAAGDKLAAMAAKDSDANVRYYAAAALRKVKP